MISENPINVYMFSICTILFILLMYLKTDKIDDNNR